MKKVISLSDYEMLYEHLERSEAWIAIDARKACADDTRAIFLGEEWGKLKRFYDDELQRVEDTIDIFIVLDPIWRAFFSENLPSFIDTFEGGINWNTVGVTMMKIARKILDAVYEIEGDNE